MAQVFDGFKRSVHATPGRLKVKCSRHGGTVAALHGKAMTFASARPPWRLSTRRISPTAFLRFKRPSFRQKHHFRPNRRGRFFPAKAQKKIAPDGSAKACLQTLNAEMPLFRMVRPKLVFKELKKCQPIRMVRPKRVFKELQEYP